MTSDDDAAGPLGARTCTSVGDFADIHGLAIDPERSDRLYAATHHGLMRATNDTGWCRVGATQDDLMGFTIHPTNGSVLWISGHPRGGGNMGVRMSTDAGYTWESIALRGVDFHAMTVSHADPDRLWGSYDGRVHRSDDGGHAWRAVGPNPEPLRSFAAHPTDRDVVYAAGAARVWQSTDAGATWTQFLDRPAAAFAVHPADAALAFAFFETGLHRSQDGGQTWTPLPLDADGGTVGYLAFTGQDPDLVYAATYQTGIYKSTDAGASWTRIKAPSR